MFLLKSPARLLHDSSAVFRCFASQNPFMANSHTRAPEIGDFSTVLANASKITVLTGAGISAESGIPTLRGEGGLWRNWDATSMATPAAFAENPSLVWEFYHYRRTIVSKATPNAGHHALAAFEKRCEREGKQFTLLTQNIDGLHFKAGSQSVVDIHGSLWKTRCCHCGDVVENLKMPICASLDGKGAPDAKAADARIPPIDLPRCQKCNGLLRPHVVWFNECLEHQTVDQVDEALDNCDLLLVVGTSAVVYPAASYAPLVRATGGLVAEFNIEDTPASTACHFKFRGPSATTLPKALGISPEELAHQIPDCSSSRSQQA